MGGFGSGRYARWGNKNSLDDCRKLDINRMVKCGVTKNDCLRRGSWVWSNKETGEETSRIGYEVNTLDVDKSYIRLIYRLTDSGEKFDYKVSLSRSTPNYGGTRFWFLCPVSGKRVSKLFMIAGDGRFLSRHVYRLGYASQSRCALGRAIDKKWKMLEKTEGVCHPIRPKGMHYKTFDKICDAFWAQEELCEDMLLQKYSGWCDVVT